MKGLPQPSQCLPFAVLFSTVWSHSSSKGDMGSCWKRNVSSTSLQSVRFCILFFVTFVYDPPSSSGFQSCCSHRDFALKWKVSPCQGMESSLCILSVLIFWKVWWSNTRLKTAVPWSITGEKRGGRMQRPHSAFGASGVLYCTPFVLTHSFTLGVQDGDQKAKKI